MTSKLKCPFCGEKLYKSNDCHVCFNANCIFANNYLFDEKWWAITKLKQALIQAKQDLEIATKALEDIKSDYELYSEQGCRMEPNETDMYNYASTALKQIDHFADVSKMIEQKDTK